jgi:hypothetical protein
MFSTVDSSLYRVGEALVHTPTRRIGVVIGVHREAPPVYYTVRFDDKSEKQTTDEHLERPSRETVSR